MLIFWQALAFAACALFDLLPSTQVQCRFDVPVAELWQAPPPGRASDLVKAPATDPRAVDTALQ